MAKKVIESVQEERDAKMYEFAFHLVPKMTEDEALKSFADIKKLVEASGAAIKNESAPALLNLEYKMELTVESVRFKYNQAYFAWIILEANGTQIAAINDEFKLRTDVIRHLLVTTKNESPISSAEVAQSLSKEEEAGESDSNEEAAPESEAEQKPEEEKAPETSEKPEESADDAKVDDAIDKITG